MNALWARLRALIRGLAPRERALLSVAGGTALLLLGYLLLVRPVAAAQRNAELRVAAAEDQLVAVRRMRTDLDEVQARLSSVEQRIARGPRGNIFTLLETLAGRSAVKVESMEPQTALSSEQYRETKVEVVLKSVTLGQAVNYLHQIESADQVLSVKSLRIRTRRDDSKLLDVTFTVSSFEPLS
jgi:type II secretory pathway component PulM